MVSKNAPYVVVPSWTKLFDVGLSQECMVSVANVVFDL
jgi:hypothetical protein